MLALVSLLSAAVLLIVVDASIGADAVAAGAATEGAVKVKVKVKMKMRIKGVNECGVVQEGCRNE